MRDIRCDRSPWPCPQHATLNWSSAFKAVFYHRYIFFAKRKKRKGLRDCGMCCSYIILSQLWRLFINSNQSPPHLAKSHALVLMHAQYTNKEIWTHTTCSERTCSPQIKKQTHLAGCPSRGLRIDLHTDKETENTFRKHAFKHQTHKLMHARYTLQTHTNKQMCVHIDIHLLTDTHTRCN